MKKIFLVILLVLASPVHAAVLDIKEVKSKSGIKAWLVEDHTIPVIAMDFAFRGSGSINDPQDLQGLSRLLSNTLDEGAGDLSSQEFQRQLTDYSIDLSFNSSRDNFGGGVKTLSKNKDKAFELLSLALTKPRFEQEAVDRMVAANMSRIRDDMTDPNWMAARLANSVLFHGHPYAMNSGGTLSSLPKITPDTLRAKLQSQMTRDRLIVSVAGDISEAELSTLLDQVFAALPATATSTKIPQVEFPSQTSVLLKQPIPQTIVQMNLPGISIHDPDYFSAQILNYILGQAGFGSRLMDVVREQNGLTYGIYSNLDTMDHASLLSISTSTRNETVKQLLDLTKAEIEKIKAEPVTEKEIKLAQAYLIGSVPLALTSTDAIAGTMLGFQRYNLPRNYLDIREAGLGKVTPQSISRVAKRLLDTSKLTTILVGQPENMQPDKTVTELENVK